MSFLRIDHVTKRFGGKTAVDDLSLSIDPGEFFSVLGPSGCGKTTLLRMIAGLEQPTTGSIHLNGREVTRLPAGERGIGMVFQNYALFPRMTVGQNVAFGLKKLNLGKDDVRSRVRKALESVHLADRGDSHVAELSGGEQQRVAVARAIVVQPALLLFDEPLSNLDAALRISTRTEIKLLQSETGITTVYVTHDQAEALSLSSRVGIMEGGRLLQYGTPAAVYHRPATAFVAGFLGSASIVSVRIDKDAGRIDLGSIAFDANKLGDDIPQGNARAAIKPEHITVTATATGSSVQGVVLSSEFQGYLASLIVEVGSVPLSVTGPSSSFDRLPARGDAVFVSIDWERCSFFTGNP